jgi:hypothetical protein
VAAMLDVAAMLRRRVGAWALVLVLVTAAAVVGARLLWPVAFYELTTGWLEPWSDVVVAWRRPGSMCVIPHAAVVRRPVDDGRTSPAGAGTGEATAAAAAVVLLERGAPPLDARCLLQGCPALRVQRVEAAEKDGGTGAPCATSWAPGAGDRLAVLPTLLWVLDEGHSATNLYHAMIAVFRLWVRLHAAGWQPGQPVRVLVIAGPGGRPPPAAITGPAAWLVASVVGPASPPVAVADVCQPEIAAVTVTPTARVCWGPLWVGNEAVGSLYWRAPQTPTSHPALAAHLRAFADHLISVHNASRIPTMARAATSWAPTVLFLLRRRMDRRLLNEDEVRAALQTPGHLPACGSVAIVDLEDYTYEDQLGLVRAAGVLVGAHGAGMTHMLFLPAGATVIELMPWQYPYLRLYANLATLVGVRHQPLWYDADAWQRARANATAASDVPWARLDEFTDKDRPFVVEDVAALVAAIDAACVHWTHHR